MPIQEIPRLFTLRKAMKSPIRWEKKVLESCSNESRVAREKGPKRKKSH